VLPDGGATVDLNDDQAGAVEDMRRWWRARSDAPFVLGGYAGTGKTTVSARLPQLLGIDPDDVQFLAPTNQARAVLRRKMAGAAPCRTVFSYLYLPHPVHCTDCPEHPERAARRPADSPAPECHVALREDGCCRLERSTRDSVEFPLVVVDEASMLRRDEYERLLSVAPRVLLVGDPGQLWPVDRANPTFSAVGEPDRVLQRIMRQGEGSEILTLAEAVRQGRPLPPARDPVGGDVRYLRGEVARPDRVPWEWVEADGSAGTLNAVIVQSNAARRAVNAARRAALGRGGPVAVAGDAVQATRRLAEGQLYNGQFLTVSRDQRGAEVHVRDEHGREYRVWLGDRTVDADGAPLNYAHAFTAHKAQGSEWDTVLVYPPRVGTPEDIRRWTYTAFTRARRVLALAVG
jgi:exodeoxyribonuclease V